MCLETLKALLCVSEDAESESISKRKFFKVKEVRRTDLHSKDRVLAGFSKTNRTRGNVTQRTLENENVLEAPYLYKGRPRVCES